MDELPSPSLAAAALGQKLCTRPTHNALKSDLLDLLEMFPTLCIFHYFVSSVIDNDDTTDEY